MPGVERRRSPTASRSARHPSQEWRASGAPAARDRAAAVAAAHSGGVAVLDIPAEAELDEPVRIRLTGTAHEVVHGHLLVRVGRFAQRHRRARAHRHARSTASSSRSSPATARSSPLVSVQEWDDDAHHLAQHDVLIGRDATRAAHRRDASAAASSGSTPTPPTPAPAARSRASASTSPTPASTSSTARSSTTARRSAAPTSSTRARCRATPPTPCGSATC